MARQLALLDSDQPLYFDDRVDGLSIRESRRAKRLILHVVPPDRLELVVPRGTSPRTVEHFVQQQRGWIEAAREEIDRRYAADRRRLPNRVVLAAVDQSFDVTYSHDPDRRSGYRATRNEISINCSEPELGDANQYLRQWLIAMGKRELRPWLFEVGMSVGQFPKGMQVRLQRTRWGSCSGTGTISLNASLLLLAPSLVRYLMIHELCHLLSMDHSRAFWRHVEKFEPDYEGLDRRLANAWTDIPYWVLAK